MHPGARARGASREKTCIPQNHENALNFVVPRDAGPSCVAPHALAPGYRKQPGGLLEFVPLHD